MAHPKAAGHYHAPGEDADFIQSGHDCNQVTVNPTAPCCIEEL